MCTFCIQIVYSFYKYLGFCPLCGGLERILFCLKLGLIIRVAASWKGMFTAKHSRSSSLTTLAVFLYSIFTIMHLHFGDIYVLVSFLLHSLPIVSQCTLKIQWKNALSMVMALRHHVPSATVPRRTVPRRTVISTHQFVCTKALSQEFLMRTECSFWIGDSNLEEAPYEQTCSKNNKACG